MSRWIRDHGPAIMMLSLAAMLLAMVLILNASDRTAASASDVPAQSRVYTDGDGNTRMDLYYRTDDMPDRTDVPSWDMYGNGLRWRFESVMGPNETEIGECWIASYVRLEYE